MAKKSSKSMKKKKKKKDGESEFLEDVDIIEEEIKGEEEGVFAKLEEETEEDEGVDESGVVEKLSLRRYAHSPEKIRAKKEAAVAAGAKFINPLDRQGAYRGCIEALAELGINEWHSHPDLYKKMENVMKEIKNGKGESLWDKFSTREERPGATSPKDVHGRIQQNARVLQRLGGKHQYGFKLRQFCMSIDIHIEPPDNDQNRNKEDFSLPNTWYYRLNTLHNSVDDAVPLYENKRPRKRRASKNSESPNTSD